jgi:putative phosphoribosyl transferase
VPVGPPDTIRMLSREVDQAVVLQTPELFWAVGAYYERFDQTSDQEVVELLREAAVEADRSLSPRGEG